jgi:hypothetical protein
VALTKSPTVDPLAQDLTRATEALRAHDDAVSAASIRVRELQDACASARTAARLAWDAAGQGVADGADPDTLTRIAVQRDGEARALEAAVATLTQRLASAGARRDALVFDIAVAESALVSQSANGMLIEWYGILDTFMQTGDRVQNLMRDLSNIRDRGAPHRQRCQEMGFPVEIDCETPEVPLPYGFDFDRFRTMAREHYLPAYRQYLLDGTPEGFLQKARNRLRDVLATTRG